MVRDDESGLIQPNSRDRRKPAIAPLAGETTQLVKIRKTFLTFITRIFLAKPDPIIPEETVSVIDTGIPSWLASSTELVPSSWAKKALG